MNQLYNIPIGFRFEPSDEELIKGFLVPKVRGFPLPWNGIVEKDLYGGNAAPWDVFRDIDDDISPSLYCNTKREGTTTKKTVYVFTKVTKAAPNSKKRISRGAGCGTWSGQTGSKCITDSATGGIIGFTKMLSFKDKGVDTDSQLFGHWIMHEYSLSAEWSSDFVLCRITRCIKDSDRRRLSSPVAVEEIHKRAAEDELVQREYCKIQKRVLVEDFNSEDRDLKKMSMCSDGGEKSNDEVEGCTLTAEERTFNDEVEGYTLTAEERTLMNSDDIEKSNHEEDFAEELEEMLIRSEESAAAPPPSTTNGCSTLSCRLDDDIGQVFSHLDSVPPPKNLAEIFEGL